METKAERFHIHNFYLLISGKRQTREGCLTDGNDQGIDFQVDINQDMLELYCSPNWQKMPLYTKCRISQNLAERGKDEKDIQKIIALAAALTMVPVITVSAAPPVSGETGYVLGEIRDRFPNLTEDEKYMAAEIVEFHLSVEGAGADYNFSESQ